MSPGIAGRAPRRRRVPCPQDQLRVRALLEDGRGDAAVLAAAAAAARDARPREEPLAQLVRFLEGVLREGLEGLVGARAPRRVPSVPAEDPEDHVAGLRGLDGVLDEAPEREDDLPLVGEGEGRGVGGRSLCRG